MNHEYKHILIENTDEYKSLVLKEIENAKNSIKFLGLLDKIISIQYYKGLFNNPDEYDEIISSKINEFYPENELNEFSDEISEFRKFLKDLLESYDIFINIFYKKLDENSEIKIKYLISEFDSLYYLDEINPEYLDEIFAYDEFDYYDYIDEIISCSISNKKAFEFITSYFDYNKYIQDLVFNSELNVFEYEYKLYYIENRN